MNQYDKEFAPESVDEQIEQLLLRNRVQADEATPQARLVRDLQDAYTEEEVLAHVWNSLVEHIENKNSIPQQNILDGQSESPQISNLANYRSTKPGKRAIISPLSLVAASLLAALVVGSLVWVVTFSRQPNSHVAWSGQQNTSPSGVYIATGNGVFRINRQTHKIIWHFKWPAPPFTNCLVDGQCPGVASLVLEKNMLYAALMDGNLYAIDANSGMLRWSQVLKTSPTLTTVVDGKLYLVVSASVSVYSSYVVYTFDPVTGKEYQHYQILRSAIGGESFSIAEQKIYVSSGNGLYAFNLANGTQVWHKQIDQKQAFSGLLVINGVLHISSTPALDNNVQAGASAGYVYAFNAQTGTQIWRSTTEGNALLTTVAENVVYLRTDQFMLDAYDAQTGKELWHRSVGTYATHMVVNAGVVYVVGTVKANSPYRGVIALNAADGSIKWQAPYADTSNSVGPSSGPVLINATLYVGDLTLHVLNAKDGSAMWSLGGTGSEIAPFIDALVVAP
jgi:outer membrane protein assembly factor BamB